MRLPIFFISLCFILLLLTDWLIISDLRKLSVYNNNTPLTKKRGFWWVAYSIFAICVLILFVVAISIPRKSVAVGISPTMWMLYIVITILISQIVYCIFSLLGFLPSIFGWKRWNTGLWVGLPMGVLFFSMMWWGALVGRYRIQVYDVNIESGRLPTSFNGYKIAQISDLHVGSWGNDTVFLNRLVQKVNGLHPDLIVFTGDLVNREAGELSPFVKTLSRLSAPDGVLSILGNHDYGDYVMWNSEEEKQSNLKKLKNYEKEMGWRLLDNRHISISNLMGDSIILIGVGNWGGPPFSQYGNLKEAYPEQNLNDGQFKILLSHNPEHWNREVSKISNIDLTLAGHTHAMQIMLSLGDRRWSPAKYKYSQWGGLYSKSTQSKYPEYLYVNIGAGEVGLPMRIGATPEITLITLHSSPFKAECKAGFHGSYPNGS